MIYARYHYAAELAAGRRVLEIACGSGQGLGLIGRAAATLVAGDIDPVLLSRGRICYGSRYPLLRMRAEQLPFRDQSFDLVLIFESSYYIPRMHEAFDEIQRVLVPGGTAVFVNANPERPDFIPSPHSWHYHTADEFRAELLRRGFQVRIEGAYPVNHEGFSPHAARTARKLLTRLGLVPRTLEGRAKLKRLAFGRLIRLPPEIPPGFGLRAKRVPVESGAVHEFKVLYVTARRG